MTSSGKNKERVMPRPGVVYVRGHVKSLQPSNGNTFKKEAN